MGWEYPKLSRRAFLQATGAGGVGLGLLQSASGAGKKDGPADSVEEVTHSICNFCSSLCNLRVTSRTKDGVKRVVKLDGNPHSTLNRGKLCARGQAGLRQTYDTDRLKTPMIRVEGTKRGEYAFRPATWDEAWEYIAKRTGEANIKPYEWTMVGGWTSCIFYMNWAVSFAMANEVPNIIASPMQHCVTTGHLGTDVVTGNFNVHDEILPDYDNARYVLLVINNSSIGAVSTCRMVRFANAKKNGAKVVVLDPRRSETAAKADEWVQIRPGTDLDFMLAMLKTMLDEGYYDADFLKRHTNMPFLIRQDAEGEWHLVTDANGHPLVIEEGTRTIHALPAVTNANTVSADGISLLPGLTAPEGFQVNGQPVMTVMQAQQKLLETYTPEWAEESTGIAADTIRRIAREFGTNRPAIVDPGWHGARFQNVLMLRRVQAMIQALTGGIDTEGGWINSGEFHHKVAHMYEAQAKGDAHAPLANLAGLPFAHMVIGAVSKGENFSHGRPGWSWAYSAQEKAAGRPHVALPVMADTGLKESVEGKVTFGGEPYRTRAVLINAANPVRHYYPDTYWKDIFANENMELVVAIDVLPSDTTPYADVLLPNSTYLERAEPTLYGNGVNHDMALTTRYAAVDPLYDTEETPDILMKMTHIVGGTEDKFLEWVEKLTGLPAEPVKIAYARKRETMKRGAFSAACREVSFAEAARKAGITVEQLDKTLREKGVFHEEDRARLLERWAIPRKMRAPTSSGRIEFFSTLFASLRGAGYRAANFSALATHVTPHCRKGLDMKAPLDQDEFYFTYGKSPTVSYASTNSNNPVLAAINRFKGNVYTGVWIHPDRAGPLGIGEGDPIRLTNTKSGQQADGHAFVTRMVHRDAVFLHSSFGVENTALTRTVGMGTATNKLVPYQVEPVVAGFRSQEFTLRVQKLGTEGGAA